MLRHQEAAMSHTYSTYEAKTKFGEVVRKK